MTINQFAQLLAKAEGKKKQVDIAQIKEILKKQQCLFKKLSGVDFYGLIYSIDVIKVSVHKADKSSNKKRRVFVSPRAYIENAADHKERG